MLLNRLGDGFILVFICFCFIFYGWGFLDLGVFGLSLFLLVFFLGVCFRKSAQFPFRTWLPLAMAAPTPISALVHSSTLVTAGIFLMFKFGRLLSFVDFGLILVVAFLVLLYSGFASLFESDFKKIIALSTLSQLAMVLFVFGFGMKFLALLHLTFHALFKSLLFLNFGAFIHMGFSNQEGRISSVRSLLLLVSSSVRLFNLVAVFFTSGFYRKD